MVVIRSTSLINTIIIPLKTSNRNTTAIGINLIIYFTSGKITHIAITNLIV
jgi:hypothetical protein